MNSTVVQVRARAPRGPRRRRRPIQARHPVVGRSQKLGVSISAAALQVRPPPAARARPPPFAHDANDDGTAMAHMPPRRAATAATEDGGDWSPETPSLRTPMTAVSQTAAFRPKAKWYD